MSVLIIYKKQLKLSVFILLILLISGFIYNNILFLDDRHEKYSLYDITADFGMIGANDGSAEADSLKNYIYINLDEQQIYVYKNGGLIRNYPCSGGKSSTPSPIGTWKIVSKSTWGEGFGGAWLGLNVPWGKYGIHGTVYPWFIGKSNASKGCIRMLNKDAKELYSLVPHGTTVTIVYENIAFRTLKNGNIGADVKMIQESLKTLGYYNAYVDGKYGKVLEASVKKFQKDNSIKQTGMVGIITFNAIKKNLQIINQKNSQ